MAVIAGNALAKDTLVGLLTARLATGPAYTPARYVSQVCLSAGISGSHAFLSSPMNQWGPGQYDELMNSCALKIDGPAGDILLLTRAAVSYYESGLSGDLMTGWVVAHAHQIGEDSVVTEIWDDRFVLGKITVFGCIVFDPQSDKYYYDMTRPAIYNNLGYPDCIDTGLGPCHAPGHLCGWRMGAETEDYIELGVGYATGRARTWRVLDVGENLRMRHIFGAGWKHNNVDVGTRALPEWVNWPRGVFNVAGGNRPLKMVSLQGWSLRDALQGIARKAGAYDIYTAPAANFRSTLQLLDMRPRGYPELTLVTPDYQNASLQECLNSANIVKEGYIVESAKNFFHDTVIMGDAPSIEIMVSTKDDDPDVGFGFEPAWSDDDETEMKTWITANGDDEAALKAAFEKWPQIYTCYRIKLGFNPWKGSKHADKVNGGRMRIKPFLNTGLQMNNADPRDWVPRPIVVEYYVNVDEETNEIPTGTPGVWLTANRFDDLTLLPDSTVVNLSALRDAGQTYYIFDDVEAESLELGINLNKHHIRMNVALEGDWPITGRATNDPNGAAARVRQDYKMTWAVASEPGMYQELLRSDKAHPEGKQELSPTYPPRQGVGSELFSDVQSGLLQTHAQLRQEDVCRVENNGMLRVALLAPATRPGMDTQLLSARGLPFRSVTKSVTFSMVGTSDDPEDKAPDTWIELGPADAAVLMEIPVAQRAGSTSPKDEETDHSPATTGAPGTSTTPAAGGSGWEPADRKDGYAVRQSEISSGKDEGYGPAALISQPQASAPQTAAAPRRAPSAAAGRGGYAGPVRDYSGKDYSTPQANPGSRGEFDARSAAMEKMQAANARRLAARNNAAGGPVDLSVPGVNAPMQKRAPRAARKVEPDDE